MTGMLTRLLRAAAARTRTEHLARRPVRLPSSLAELDARRRQELEELVILGVLLHEVAHADGTFSPEEQAAVARTLRARGVKEEEAALVIAAAHESAASRFDLQGFTREVNKHPYKERLRVLDLLFGIGCADGHLSHAEIERVRKIANLLWIDHKDFIDAKLRCSKGL